MDKNVMDLDHTNSANVETALGNMSFDPPTSPFPSSGVITSTPGDTLTRFIEQFFLKCKELQQRKRRDYTGSHHALYNYEKSGEVVGISTGQSMLARMQEKVIRLSLALETKQLHVNDESVNDTCQDVAILASLIAYWWVDGNADRIS